jgi:hypothetical protein
MAKKISFAKSLGTCSQTGLIASDVRLNPTFDSRIDSEFEKLTQQLQQKSLEKEKTGNQNNDHILYSTIKIDVH